MPERLTDDDLSVLEKRLCGPDAYIMQGLIAEIRELREEVDTLADGITKVNNEGVKHRRVNARLREYVRHRNDPVMFCEALKHADYPCTCGLEAALAQPQGGSDANG